jgi:PAS domain S-box-containing protein
VPFKYRLLHNVMSCANLVNMNLGNFYRKPIDVSTLLALVVSALLVLSGLLFQLLLSSIVEQVGFLLLYPIVLICAWIGGLRVGLFAISLSALGVWFIFIPEAFSFKPLNVSWLIRLGVFVLFSGTISVLMNNYQKRLYKLQKAKQKIEQLFDQRQLILDAAKMGWWIYDPAEQNGVYDERYAEIFGLSRLNVPLEEILEKIHPDDRDNVRTSVSKALDPVSPQSYEVEYRILINDGNVRWVAVYGTVQFEGEGEQRYPRKLVGTIVDITERRNISEAILAEREMLTRLIERLPVMITIYDPSINNFQFNDEFKKVLGWTEVDAKEKDLMKLAYPDEKTRIAAVSHMSNPDSSWREFQVMSKRGELISSSWANIKTGQKQVGIGIDLRKEKENTKKLEEALSARDEFLSITSHELKTPLTSLKLLSQIARKELENNKSSVLSPEKVQKLIIQTDELVNRLNRLVDDMLDINRLRANKFKIIMDHIELKDLISEVIERMRPSMVKAGTLPEFKCSTKIEGYWDRGRIEQVVTNLLTNAMKYGNQKPVKINLERQENLAILSVEDQGMGILEADKRRIFNHFERAISASEVSGLGLGLYITHHIVAAHGGKIWVESEGKDSGSKFIVHLPIRRE